MTKRHFQRRIRDQAGFSMIEVSLALLVVALGLLILMGLLPTGLREVESAVENTRAAMFADDLFNRFQANALLVESRDDFVRGDRIFGYQQGQINTGTTGGGGVRWRYYKELNQAIPWTPVWRIRLEIKAGLDGPFISTRITPLVFYTELAYGVSPP